MTRVYGTLARAYMRLTRRLVCQRAVALMSEYLDGELSAADAARLERHLAGCGHCAEYLAQLRVTVDALGAVAPDDLTDEALDGLVNIYRQWRADPA